MDIHKKSVVACLLTPKGKQIRTFGTMTTDILAMADWLQGEGCTHVAMESTGVYWKPIYNLLEGYEQFELLVVNAQHIKAVPGRKTDVKDSEWIADLLRHGLLRASFIPDAAQRDLRELTRYRTTPHHPCEGASLHRQPFAEGAGRCQYQAGGRGYRYRYHGCIRPCHVGVAAWWAE
ncbi:MAG TPA: IS110 family transposase [Ktedonobacteraceae bacterium]